MDLIPPINSSVQFNTNHFFRRKVPLNFTEENFYILRQKQEGSKGVITTQGKDKTKLNMNKQGFDFNTSFWYL